MYPHTYIHTYTDKTQTNRFFAHRAMVNSSRTIRAPSPTYFCTSSDPITRMKHASVRFATARAESVLPVPGGLLIMVGWFDRLH